MHLNMNDCVERALVSYCVISYNQEQFIQHAVNASLAQSFKDMEVIISDDCSSDKTFDVIQNSLKDNSKTSVQVNYNAINQGINVHVNTIVGLSHGDFIVISSGDDISMPTRVEKLVGEWQDGAIGVFSNAESIDSQGNIKGLFMHQGYKHLATWQEMVVAGSHGAWGCTFAWDRKIFDIFGSLPLNILGEDASIPFRCALLGKVAYIDEPLVKYRDHGGNVSFWAQMKNASAQDLLKTGEKIIRFDQTLYQNWRKDIATAASSDYLSKEEVKWAGKWLTVHEEIRRVQLRILKCSYMVSISTLICELWHRRISEHRKLWVKRLIGMFLQFRMPWLYKTLLHFKGMSRSA